MQGSTLEMVSFKGANLSGVDFSNSTILYTNFSGANLLGAKMNGAVIFGSNFSQANLSNADLLNATLNVSISDGAVFCGVRMPNGTRSKSCFPG